MLSKYVRAVFADSTGAAFVADDGFDMKATISRSHTKEPDTAELTIYNVAENTRRKLGLDVVTLAVYAGKTALDAAQIFKGEVTDAINSKSEDFKDWESLILAEDTRSALRTRMVARSYREGSPLATVLLDLGAAAGVQVDAVAPGKLVSPLALLGPARDLIQQVCKQYSLRYQIIDGRVIVRTADAPVSLVQVPVISAATGMIGLPTASLERKKVVKVTVSCELNPLLTPGGLCSIQTTATVGGRKAPIKPAAVYWIERVTHEIGKDVFKSTVICREHV